MGTSSSFGGPKNNPLLPDDFDDNSWKNVKTEFSKFLNNNSSDTSRLFGKYVKASGGSSTIANSARGGKTGFVNTVNLLNQINSNGLEFTLESLQLSAKGKSMEVIFSELANQIAPTGNTKEEAVARQSILETMSFFYSLIEERNLDLDIINNISEDIFTEVMCNYFVNYITGLLLTNLGYSAEKYINNPAVLEEKEKEMRFFVDNSIYIMLTNSELYNKNPQDIVDKIFNDAFEFIGGSYE